MSGSIALGDFQSGDGAATRANRDLLRPQPDPLKISTTKTALQGKIPRFCVVRTPIKAESL